MKNKILILFIATMFSLVNMSSAMAEENVVVDNAGTATQANTSESTNTNNVSDSTNAASVDVVSPVIETVTTTNVSTEVTTTENNNLIENQKSVPTAFGLFWTDLRDSLRLAFTFDAVDKAELELQIAEEKTKLAEYVSQTVTDPEKASKIIEKLTKKADKLIANAEKKQENIANSKNKKKEAVLQNIKKQEDKSNALIQKLEGKIPEDKLEKIKTRQEERNKKMQEKIDNTSSDATNISEDNNQANLESETDDESLLEDNGSVVKKNNKIEKIQEIKNEKRENKGGKNSK